MCSTLPKVSVVTATYNRAYILDNAYQSLLRQTDSDFEWIVIDDGSTDNTKELVTRWAESKQISLIYRCKDNGGVHTARNLGISLARGELVLFLDSDDYLTDDAIETIKNEWKGIDTADDLIAGLCFLRGYSSTGQPIGTLFPKNHYRANTIQMRCVDKVKGDKAEVYRAKVLKDFPFPVIEDVKFVTEEIVFNRIAKQYDIVHINKIIYKGEYLEDGITASLKDGFVSKNTRGYILCYNEKTTRPFPLLQRIHYMERYIRISFLASISRREILRNSRCKWLCCCVMPFNEMTYSISKFFKKLAKSL